MHVCCMFWTLLCQVVVGNMYTQLYGRSIGNQTKILKLPRVARPPNKTKNKTPPGARWIQDMVGDYLAIAYHNIRCHLVKLWEWSAWVFNKTYVRNEWIRFFIYNGSYLPALPLMFSGMSPGSQMLEMNKLCHAAPNRLDSWQPLATGWIYQSSWVLGIGSVFLAS